MYIVLMYFQVYPRLYIYIYIYISPMEILDLAEAPEITSVLVEHPISCLHLEEGFLYIATNKQIRRWQIKQIMKSPVEPQVLNLPPSIQQKKRYFKNWNYYFFFVLIQ